jgi:membrane-bound lytic murein transglycosylase D
LAAYNSGEWRVLNRIKNQRINYLDNFWDLHAKLPRETAFYVPKFLAVLHLLSDPESHGITLPPPDEEIKVEQVTIDKQVHLKAIAQRLEIDYGTLRDLNPELRHSSTPNTPYSIKVPVGQGEILLAKISEIPEWHPPQPAYVIHRVRNGESLSLIADRYKTSVRSIMAMNGLRNRNYVRVGWKLKIPTRRRYASRTNRPPIYALKPKGNSFQYTVRKGDSLWLIANRYNTTTRSIRTLNQLRGSTLRIGQVLLLSKRKTTSNPVDSKQYRVRGGDSPYLIAKRHEMNLTEFLKLNNLTPRSTIFPGQIVRIKAE